MPLSNCLNGLQLTAKGVHVPTVATTSVPDMKYVGCSKLAFLGFLNSLPH